MNKRLYYGIFSLSIAMLMFQVLLTRVLSVTMYYHFAFLTVTIAMFGITLGAVLIQHYSDKITEDSILRLMSRTALGFGWISFIVLLTHMSIPGASVDSITGVFGIVWILLLLIAAFTSGGACICLCLTRFPEITSKLYAVDLVGAALGSLLTLFLLPYFNAPALVLVVLFFSGVAGLAFSEFTWRKAAYRLSGATILIPVLAIALELSTPIEHSFFRLVWVKGEKEAPPIFERWNSFSRVSVTDYTSLPFGWGLSSRYSNTARIEQKYVTIDSAASTPITRFDGSFANLTHLKADVINLVYYLRNSADVFVVGVGGGRDILSALMFGQRSIKGVEINPHIVSAMRGPFNEFAGRLLENPAVTVIVDEARSFISRESKKYDIIQVSLVDTFAASASGAFVLTENSLYTMEAWGHFLDHLSPHGLLSVSRWWSEGYPAEAYRTLTLAVAALRARNIANPERHLMVVVNRNPLYRANTKLGIVSILVSPDPLSEQDVAAIKNVSTEMDFDVLHAPFLKSDPTILRLIQEPSAVMSDALGMELNPPTDNAPFFFHLTRLKDIISGVKTDGPSAQITTVLFLLVAACFPLSYLCLVKPVLSRCSDDATAHPASLMGYFAAIGMGFMLIEVAQMQHFSMFLGHPTYGISVVLSTLLLSSGLGSYCSRFIGVRWERASIVAVFAVACAVGLATFYGSDSLRQSQLAVRIVTSIAFMCPLGIALGMGFPLGMREVQRNATSCSALYWGVNGAASVCAGVAAVLIAITVSISTAFWAGALCYAAAGCCFWKASSR